MNPVLQVYIAHHKTVRCKEVPGSFSWKKTGEYIFIPIIDTAKVKTERIKNIIISLDLLVSRYEGKEQQKYSIYLCFFYFSKFFWTWK